MTLLNSTLEGLGSALCVIAFVWASCTRHQRHVWQRAGHNASTAAIVLELQREVRRLEPSLEPVETR
jgi:hypothetical protein